MSHHVKLNRNFIVLVDAWRRPSRQRSTAGRYQVGAKNPREAMELVRKAIGFGSPKVYRECEDRPLAHGVVKYCVSDGPGWRFEDPVHATAKRK